MASTDTKLIIPGSFPVTRISSMCIRGKAVGFVAHFTQGRATFHPMEHFEKSSKNKMIRRYKKRSPEKYKRIMNEWRRQNQVRTSQPTARQPSASRRAVSGVRPVAVTPKARSDEAQERDERLNSRNKKKAEQNVSSSSSSSSRSRSSSSSSPSRSQSSSSASSSSSRSSPNESRSPSMSRSNSPVVRNQHRSRAPSPFPSLHSIAAAQRARSSPVPAQRPIAQLPPPSPATSAAPPAINSPSSPTPPPTRPPTRLIEVDADPIHSAATSSSIATHHPEFAVTGIVSSPPASPPNAMKNTSASPTESRPQPVQESVMLLLPQERALNVGTNQEEVEMDMHNIHDIDTPPASNDRNVRRDTSNHEGIVTTSSVPSVTPSSVALSSGSSISYLLALALAATIDQNREVDVPADAANPLPASTPSLNLKIAGDSDESIGNQGQEQMIEELLPVAPAGRKRVSSTGCSSSGTAIAVKKQKSETYSPPPLISAEDILKDVTAKSLWELLDSEMMVLKTLEEKGMSTDSDDRKIQIGNLLKAVIDALSAEQMQELLDESNHSLLNRIVMMNDAGLLRLLINSNIDVFHGVGGLSSPIALAASRGRDSILGEYLRFGIFYAGVMEEWTRGRKKKILQHDRNLRAVFSEALEKEFDTAFSLEGPLITIMAESEGTQKFFWSDWPESGEKGPEEKHYAVACLMQRGKNGETPRIVGPCAEEAPELIWNGQRCSQTVWSSPRSTRNFWILEVDNIAKKNSIQLFLPCDEDQFVALQILVQF